MKAWALFFSLIFLPFLLFAQRDTINRYDSLGYKTGFWRIKAAESNLPEHKLPEYKPDNVVEEGRFFINKKEGVWKRFYPNGQLKSEVSFHKNRLHGPAKIYYENGCVYEEGTWKNNRWVGEYRQFSKDTCGKLILKFKFDSLGRREGRPVVNYREPSSEEGNWLPGPCIKEGISAVQKQPCKIQSLRIDVAGGLRLTSTCEIKTIHLLIFGSDGALAYASDSLMNYKGMICLDPNAPDVSYYHIAWSPPAKKKKGYTWAIRYTTHGEEKAKEEKGKVLVE